MKDILHSVFFLLKEQKSGITLPKNTALYLFLFIDHIKNDKILDILQLHVWSNKILKTILTIHNNKINIKKIILSKILICLQ